MSLISQKMHSVRQKVSFRIYWILLSIGYSIFLFKEGLPYNKVWYIGILQFFGVSILFIALSSIISLPIVLLRKVFPIVCRTTNHLLPTLIIFIFIFQISGFFSNVILHQLGWDYVLTGYENIRPDVPAEHLKYYTRLIPEYDYVPSHTPLSSVISISNRNNLSMYWWLSYFLVNILGVLIVVLAYCLYEKNVQKKMLN